MQWAKFLIVLLIVTLVLSCFLPWVTIESKHIVVTGFRSQGTNFGKPALLHFFLCGLYLVFFSFGTKWFQRAAFFTSALNVAWAIRNFIVISTCNGGICPEKQLALYALLSCSLLILLLTLLVRVENKMP